MRIVIFFVVIFISITVHYSNLIKSDSSIIFSVSSKLKTGYTKGKYTCANKNFRARGEYVSCMEEYIRMNAPLEYDNYLKIKQYCDNSTDNECEKDNCVDMFTQ